MARDNRSGLWGAQERARKVLVHANKVRERTKRALRVAEAPRDTIAMPKPWRLTGRSGQPPPNGDALWPVMLTLYQWLNATSSKYSEYVEYLRRTVPTIAALATAHPLHLIEFQRLLRPGEALVATQVTPSALYVWAITPVGVQVARQRITEAEVTNTVTRLRASLKPSSGSGSLSLPAFDAASAYQLYSLIFAPIADQLRGVRTLIWYGQGPLGAVPPAVLVTAPPATPSRPRPESAQEHRRRHKFLPLK